MIKTDILFGKIDEQHNDSFWYDGDIAKLTSGNREVLLIAAGRIRIHNKNGEIVHDGSKERNSGIEGGLNNDEDLKKIGSYYDDKYYWENNNWFEPLYRLKGEKNWEDILGVVEYYYDDAIKMCKKMLKDDKFWKNFKKDFKKEK